MLRALVIRSAPYTRTRAYAKAHRSKHTVEAVSDIYLIRRLHGRSSADKSSGDRQADIADLDDAPIHWCMTANRLKSSTDDTRARSLAMASRGFANHDSVQRINITSFEIKNNNLKNNSICICEIFNNKTNVNFFKEPYLLKTFLLIVFKNIL